MKQIEMTVRIVNGREWFMNNAYSWAQSCLDCRIWRVVPYTDSFLIFDAATCVTDDFGNLVRVS